MTYQDLTGERRREPRIEAIEQRDGPPPGPPGGGSKWRGRLLGALVALAAIAGFAGIAWYAMNQGKKDSATVVPMIQADKSPVKVLPEKPGGMKVPNQDKLIYMQIAPDGKEVKKEKVLPEAEKPMEKPKPPEAMSEKAVESAEAPKVPEAEKPEPMTQAPLQPPKMEAPVAPKEAGEATAKAEEVKEKAEEAKEKAEGEALDRDALRAKVAAAAKDAEKEATKKAEPEAAAEAPKPSEAAKTEKKPKEEAKADASSQMAKATPSEAAKPEKPSGPAFQVQLGSSRLEDRAKAEVERLNKLYDSLLGDVKISAVRADLGERGVFFRLWAGPFHDRAAAEEMCSKLKARKQGCLVIQR